MDRRFILAILLMMVVLVVPSFFMKKPARPAPQVAAPVVSVDSLQNPAVIDAPPGSTPSPLTVESDAPAADDSVTVSSPLYRYTFSTRGGRMVAAELLNYKSMRKDEPGQQAQIFARDGDFLTLGLLVGRDTIPLRNLAFRPTTTALDVVAGSSARLGLTAALDSTVGIDLEYTFLPDDYRIGVTGRLRGLGAAGATVLIGLGPGLRNTESDSVEHGREVSVVTKHTKSSLKRFSDLDVGVTETLPGPFEWVGVKSKYFVAAVLALDSARIGQGRLGGVQATATDRLHRKPEQADVWTSLSVGADGAMAFTLYVGPMEYPRLRSIGHDFDDINPYGWAWLRPVIRPVAVGARALLVWMHESLGLAYGLGLVVFGILVRVVLWPLNQKAMRAGMAMQAVQPILKDIQERYKNDPQKLQQETFRVYREHKVNPFGGCWPILLPWPILIALFFVFQNTIELRGQSFLWVPDLSRADPTFIIPVIMAVSMFGVTKVGQIGLPPNPQMKMMLYVMPVMMLVLFFNFASGLNLYYAVQNIASIPQQWLIAKERMRNAPATTAQVIPPAPPKKAKKKQQG